MDAVDFGLPKYTLRRGGLLAEGLARAFLFVKTESISDQGTVDLRGIKPEAWH
jgi:hypothetical protein